MAWALGLRGLRAPHHGQQVRPAARGLERAQVHSRISQEGRGQSSSPGSPSWLFPSHHKLFDPQVTQRQRRKESKIQLASSKRVKDKGRPGPRGSHGTSSLGFAVLWPPAWDPGAPPAPPRDPGMGMTAVFGKQTLGLQGGVLAGQTREGPPPHPRGVPAAIPRGESRQSEAEWRQAWVWPPGEDLLAPAGSAPPPAPASLIPSPGLGGVWRQREPAEAVERALARALNCLCG